MPKLPFTDFIQKLRDAGATAEVILVAVRELEISQMGRAEKSNSVPRQISNVTITKRDIDGDKKKKAAERKRLWRLSKAGQAGDKTLNVPILSQDTVEKTPNIEPLVQEVLKEEQKVSKSVTARGFRLPADFVPNAACEALARELKLTRAQWNNTLAEFKDYWDTVPGQRGTKLDWHKTFRVRLHQKGTPKNGYQSSKQQHAAAAQSALDEQYRFLSGASPQDTGDGGLQDGPVIDNADDGGGNFSDG